MQSVASASISRKNTVNTIPPYMAGVVEPEHQRVVTHSGQDYIAMDERTCWHNFQASSPNSDEPDNLHTVNLVMYLPRQFMR